MMRITQQQDGGTITLKIEGRLACEWVNEMKRCWDEVRNDTCPCVIRIDLTEVTFIDAAGRDLLATMFQSGVRPTAANVMTKAVIEQLACNFAINPQGSRTAQTAKTKNDQGVKEGWRCGSEK